MIQSDENITIIRKGGFIVTQTYLQEVDEHGNKIYSQEVELIEETDNEKADLQRLLECIAEKCGYSYDKFGSENLNITFDKKGHKVD
jgi:hypothetical protein